MVDIVGLVHNARTVDVFAQEPVIAVVFSNHVTAIIDVFYYVTTNDILFDAPAGNTLLVQDKMTTNGLERDNITKKDSTRKAKKLVKKPERIS